MRWLPMVSQPICWKSGAAMKPTLAVNPVTTRTNDTTPRGNLTRRKSRSSQVVLSVSRDPIFAQKP